MNPSFWYQKGYFLRRLGKIGPPFYLSLAIAVGICIWNYDMAGIDAALKWATGIANFVQTPTSFSPFYWSLIVECHFYLLLPFLFLLTRGRSVTITALFIFSALLIFPVCARWLTWPTGMVVWPDENSSATCGFLFTRFPCQLDYFAYGVLFAGIFVALDTVREKIIALGAFGYLGIAMLTLSLLFWGSWVTEFDIRAHPARWSVEVAHFFPALATMLILFFCLIPKPWARAYCQ